jgi:undecaprenyl-diphosphatase
VDLIYAIILGIIEGLTEFLPVSSTGHMVIAMPMMGVSPSKPPWNVLLWVSQFAAILAVIVVFWRDLWRRTIHPPRAGWHNHIFTKLIAAMIPTVVLAVLFHEFFEPLERSPVAVAAALILGAGAMELIDRRFRRNVRMELDDISVRQAFLLGLIQCISMWPGVSRSGATIFGGMALGLSPRVATEFTFYLAIPTMLAAAAKTLLDEGAALSAGDLWIVLVGSAVSFVVALVVIIAFLDFVKRYRFTVFAAYRVVLGVAVLAYYFLVARSA